MEWGSNGVVECWKAPGPHVQHSTTPTLHYSIIPFLHLSILGMFLFRGILYM